MHLKYNKKWRGIAAFLLIFICAHTAIAAERWQLVVLPDVEYQPTENVDIHRALSRKLSEQLTSNDFDVFSYRDLGIPNCIEQDCSSWTLTKLRQTARKAGKEINLVMRYQISISKQSGAAIDKWKFNLRGNWLDVESNMHLEAFDVDGRYLDIQANCKGDCFTQWLADKSAELAQDLGVVMSEKLSALPRRYYYNMHISDFTPEEVQQIDGYIKQLPSYVADSLERDFNAQSQLLHSITSRHVKYISEQSGTDLSNTIQAVIAEHGIPIHVSYSKYNRQLALSRAQMPYLFAYISAAMGFVLLLYVAYFASQRNKHQLALNKLASQGHAQQWLNYFKQANSPLIPKNKAWFEQEKQWLDNISQAKALAEQAWLLAEQHDYDQAQEKIEAALALNSDNSEAQTLKQNIVDYKRGYERLQLANAEVESHPSAALPLLKEAKQLNPRLARTIEPLEKRCISLMHERLGKTAISNAQSAIEQGQTYQAFAIIDRTLLEIAGVSSFVQEQTQLSKLRERLKSSMTPLSGAIVGGEGLSGHYFYSHGQVQLGRTVADPASTIILGYKRVSRTGKQMQFVRQNGRYFIEDMGSTNGTHYDGQALTPSSRVECQDGNSLILGSGQGSGPCQLETIIPNNTQGCLILKLAPAVLRFIDNTNMGQIWPSLDQDLNKCWVLLENKLPISITDDNTLEIGSTDRLIAYLSVSDNVYYIEPATLNAEQSDVLIQQQPVHGKVPIMSGVFLTLAGQPLVFEECQ